MISEQALGYFLITKDAAHDRTCRKVGLVMAKTTFAALKGLELGSVLGILSHVFHRPDPLSVTNECRPRPRECGIQLEART